jgi:CubicO group peptidase (beta-lactamase class C family)
MILLLLVLDPAISQVGPVKAQQSPLPAPSPTPALLTASEELWLTNGWPTATPAEMGMDETKLKQARDFAVSQGRGSGFITRRGKLILSWGSSSQRYALKSTAKSIGVTTLGLAIKDGLMNLSDKAQQHYPGSHPKIRYLKLIPTSGP